MRQVGITSRSKDKRGSGVADTMQEQVAKAMGRSKGKSLASKADERKVTLGEKSVDLYEWIERKLV